MPVPAQLRLQPGHHHQVADAHGDLLVAPGARVRLAGLVGLHPPDLEVEVAAGVYRTAHSTSAAHTSRAAATIR